MSWSDCGEDKYRRPIGYAHDGVCDHEGCTTEIDRGLSYACGGMHGDDEHSCDKYFCSEHLEYTVQVDDDEYKQICQDCMVRLTTSGDWALHVEDWVIKPIPVSDESFDFSEDEEDPCFGDDMMGSSS